MGESDRATYSDQEKDRKIKMKLDPQQQEVRTIYKVGGGADRGVRLESQLVMVPLKAHNDVVHLETA